MQSMADKLFEQPNDPAPVETDAEVDETPAQEATVVVSLNPDGPLAPDAKHSISVPGFDDIELSGSGSVKVTPAHADSLLTTNFVVVK